MFISTPIGNITEKGEEEEEVLRGIKVNIHLHLAI